MFSAKLWQYFGFLSFPLARRGFKLFCSNSPYCIVHTRASTCTHTHTCAHTRKQARSRTHRNAHFIGACTHIPGDSKNRRGREKRIPSKSHALHCKPSKAYLFSWSCSKREKTLFSGKKIQMKILITDRD